MKYKLKYILIILILLYTSLVNAQGATTGTNDDYYATNADDVTNGLVLWWPGRHDGLSYAQDVSSYKVQGTITGASWGLGRGLYFDGIDDSVVFNLTSITNYPFTLSMWAKPQTGDNGSFRGLIIGTSSVVAYGIGFSGIAGAVTMQVSNGTSSFPVVQSGQLNTWVHLVAVFNSSIDRKIYVDGVQKGTSTISINFGTITSCAFPRFKINQYFGFMSIRDVRIYQRGLISDEPMRIYQATKQ